MEESPPPVVSSVGHSTTDKAGDAEEESDSGDSLFITQHKVPEPTSRKKTRRRQTPSFSRGDGNGSDIGASLSSSGKEQPAGKQEKVKPPTFKFPFLQNKSNRVGLTFYKNIKLHYGLMGGFLIGVRNLQLGINGGELLQEFLPTIDGDGVCLAPISENEDGDLKEEPIRVVRNNCFVISTKSRRFQRRQNPQSRPTITPGEGDSPGDQRHRKSKKDGFKVCSKVVEVETSTATVLKKQDKDTRCPKRDATVCEPNDEEQPNINSGASETPEIFPQPGDHGGQNLSEDGSNNYTDCHENMIKEKKKKRKRKHKSREAQHELNPEHEGEETHNSPIGDAVGSNNIPSLQVFSKKKTKKKIRPEIAEVIPIQQEEKCSDKPQEPAEGTVEADIKTKKRKKKNALGSISTCSETVAEVKDSDSATPSFPFADAEEKIVSCPCDPTSAEICPSFEEDIVLGERRKKKKMKTKLKAADDKEKSQSQSGNEIEVSRKKKRKKENMSISESPDSAADVESTVLIKKRKTLTSNDSETNSSGSLQAQTLTEFKTGHSSKQHAAEQTSDTPKNVKKTGKRKLHNPLEDFLSEG